jgi:hypothetical protein
MNALLVVVYRFYYPLQSFERKAFLLRVGVMFIFSVAAWISLVFWAGLAEWASSTFQTEKMLKEFITRQEAARLEEQKPNV